MSGDDNARKRLIQLGPERLADMLMKLALEVMRQMTW